MKFYTDYPFDFLGDKEYEDAPIRQIEVISYDGNKYCKIKVEGKKTDLKSGYIYTKKGRYGKVPQITRKVIYSFPCKAIWIEEFRIKEKLKLCPLCGNDITCDDYTDQINGIRLCCHYIECGKCQLTIYSDSFSENVSQKKRDKLLSELAKRWNKRCKK